MATSGHIQDVFWRQSWHDLLLGGMRLKETEESRMRHLGFVMSLKGHYETAKDGIKHRFAEELLK